LILAHEISVLIEAGWLAFSLLVDSDTSLPWEDLLSLVVSLLFLILNSSLVDDEMLMLALIEPLLSRLAVRFIHLGKDVLDLDIYLLVLAGE
jgi:hypothetical protein